ENILDAGADPGSYRHPDWALPAAPGGYLHALVTRVLPLEIHARIGPPDDPGSEILLLPPDWQWTGQRRADSLVIPGDIVYVKLASADSSTTRRASLEQDSGAQGALLATENTSGD